MDHPGINLEQLPPTTIEEVKERIQSGEELSIGAFSQALASIHHPNCLQRMREISETTFLVFDEQKNPTGRMERPYPSPLPEECDQVIARCNEHILALRNRLDDALRKLNESSLSTPSHAQRIAQENRGTTIRFSILLLEYEISKVRNALLSVYYNEYAHDEFHDTEHYSATLVNVEAIYQIHRGSLEEIEKTVGNR